MAAAQEMERLIPDAGLVTLEGAGHFSYLDQPTRFARIVSHFIAPDQAQAAPDPASTAHSDPTATAHSDPTTTADPDPTADPDRHRHRHRHRPHHHTRPRLYARAQVPLQRGTQHTDPTPSTDPTPGGSVSAFEGIAAVLAIAALSIRLAGRQHRLLHLLQLEHYEGARLMLWLRRRNELFAPRELLATSLIFAAAVASSAASSGWLCGALLLTSCPLAALGVGDWRREAVKPLVLTGRAKRLLAVALLAPALLFLATITLAAAGLTTAALAVLLALGCAPAGRRALDAADGQPRPAAGPAGDQPTLRGAREALPARLGPFGGRHNRQLRQDHDQVLRGSRTRRPIAPRL